MLILGSAASCLSCNSEKEHQTLASHARSEAVLATAPPPSAPAQPLTKTPGERVLVGPAGPSSVPLCTPGAGGQLPEGSLQIVAEPGAPPLEGQWLPGRLYFINLWAAWCEPCKKEIPLLLQWQEKLRAEGLNVDLAFVSLDDDVRQLKRFLRGQLALRATYHLAEGSERVSFLAALDQPEDPRLPVQLLIDREGRVACRIEGSLEANDYERVLQRFKGL